MNKIISAMTLLGLCVVVTGCAGKAAVQQDVHSAEVVQTQEQHHDYKGEVGSAH